MIDMEEAISPPGSPDSAALQPISPDRVNHQRENPALASLRASHRDSDVHDKIRQFNNLAHVGHSTASMSKQLERRTADAALKRAMLGREEAESEMRRYREEARALRKQVDEGRERERKVGERLETVMESYGRAKETYSHTQSIWEKEIRRARKETFKSQSSIVKLQEEVKAARNATKSVEEVLERQKALSEAREQEAFKFRYQVVEVQQQLDQALERVNFVETERDAYKAAAKSEEVARIAAEGRLPLPPEEPDSEFASPKKTRESLTTADIKSSAVSEAEIDELTELWQWERQRADRIQERVDFMEAECHLRLCPCARSQPRRSLASSSTRKQRPSSIAIIDPADLMILGKKPEPPKEPIPDEKDPEQAQEPQVSVSPVDDEVPAQETPDHESVDKSERRKTFFPAEGIFRTVSQQELEAMEQQSEEATLEPPTPVDAQSANHPFYSRTPSVEPPSYAVIHQDQRTSLLSLLNAPRESEAHCKVIDIPTTSEGSPLCSPRHENEEEYEEASPEEPEDTIPEIEPEPEAQPQPLQEIVPQQQQVRPHTSAALYKITTTTTTIPLRGDEEDDDENAKPRSASLSRHNSNNNKSNQNHGRTPSFDITNPALTPTMTREQALAQIKERRGRARSAMQGGAVTPRKQMLTGVLGERRDVSAPAGRLGGGGTTTTATKAERGAART